MPLVQLVHITAAYSNAVLVAILPHVNDFSKKVDLPIPLPITTSQVERFNPNPTQGIVGGSLWLTNGYQFVFDNGVVTSFKMLNGNPFLTEARAGIFSSPVFPLKDFEGSSQVDLMLIQLFSISKTEFLSGCSRFRAFLIH